MPNITYYEAELVRSWDSPDSVAAVATTASVFAPMRVLGILSPSSNPDQVLINAEPGDLRPSLPGLRIQHIQSEQEEIMKGFGDLGLPIELDGIRAYLFKFYETDKKTRLSDTPESTLTTPLIVAVGRTQIETPPKNYAYRSARSLLDPKRGARFFNFAAVVPSRAFPNGVTHSFYYSSLLSRMALEKHLSD